MHFTKTRNILFLLIGIVLVGCSQHTEFRRELDWAEALMQENPDSALALLQGIDSAIIDDDLENRALHALLLSQAMDKNYIDSKDDSLVSIAVNYYENSDDIRHRMLAHYYHGRILYNAEQYPQSLIAMLQAMQDAKSMDDKFWIAMSARSISDIYKTTHHGPESIKYAKIAAENFKISEHHLYHIWAIADLAIAYNNNGDYDSSMVFSQELLDSAISCHNSELESIAKKYIGRSYFGKNKYAEAIPYYIARCADSTRATLEDSAHLAILYINTNQSQKAQKLMNDISDTTAKASIWMRQEMYSKTNETAKALDAYKEEQTRTAILLEEIIRQNLSGALADYNHAQELKHKDGVHTMQLGILVLVLVILLVSFSAWLYISHQRTKIERYITVAEELYIASEQAKKENSETQTLLRNSMKNKFMSFANLLSAYHGLSCQETTKQNIVSELDKLVSDFSITGVRHKELEEEVNAVAGNLMANLRRDVPRLKEIDYILYLYSALGFTNPVLVMFLQVKDINVVYNRKKRIREKLRDLPDETGNYYLSFLN